MKLSKLLKNITPLPWSTPHFALPQSHWDKITSMLTGRNTKSRCDCGYMLCNSLMGAIATVHKGDVKNEGDDPVGKAADSNAIYLAHAANVLPNLVKASNRFKAALGRVETLRITSVGAKLELAEQEFVEASFELSAALARAEEVKMD